MQLTCMSPLQSCDNVGLSGLSEQSCPFIVISGEANGDYLIHTNMSKALVIHTKNLDVFGSNDFYCVISNGSTEFYNKPGIWDSESSTVTCENSIVSWQIRSPSFCLSVDMLSLFFAQFSDVQLSEETPLLTAMLEIKWQGMLSIENPQDVKGVYACTILPDC